MTTLEHTFLDATLAIALLALLSFAVHQDLREHRISNALTLAGFLGALILQTLLDGAQGLAGALAGAGIGLLCFLPLYFSKGIGAGDVKLMASAGAFFGPADAFIAALLSLAAGAVLAIIVVAWRAVEFRAATARHAIAASGGSDTAPVQPQRNSRMLPTRPPEMASILG